MTRLINIYSSDTGHLIPVGHLLAESFHPELYLNTCNWHHRKHAKKPDNLVIYDYSQIEAGRGICFEDTHSGIWHLALSIGWLSGSREEIEQYIEENIDKRLWLKD